MYSHSFMSAVMSALPRLTSFALFSMVLSVAILFFAPQQLPVIVYKLLMVTLGAVSGYWVDRALFPYARPHLQVEINMARSLAMLRRALVVLACVLGLTLGL